MPKAQLLCCYVSFALIATVCTPQTGTCQPIDFGHDVPTWHLHGYSSGDYIWHDHPDPIHTPPPSTAFPHEIPGGGNMPSVTTHYPTPPLATPSGRWPDHTPAPLPTPLRHNPPPSPPPPTPLWHNPPPTLPLTPTPSPTPTATSRPSENTTHTTTPRTSTPSATLTSRPNQGPEGQRESIAAIAAKIVSLLWSKLHSSQQEPISPRALRMLSFMQGEQADGGRTSSETPETDIATDVAITIGRRRSLHNRRGEVTGTKLTPIYIDPTKTNCSTSLLEALQWAYGNQFNGQDMTKEDWAIFTQTWQMMNAAAVAQRGNELRQGAVKALLDKGMGTRITSLYDMKKGELIQAFPQLTGTDGHLMQVSNVSGEGSQKTFTCISAGHPAPGNSYKEDTYTIEDFNRRYREHYIVRLK